MASLLPILNALAPQAHAAGDAPFPASIAETVDGPWWAALIVYLPALSAALCGLYAAFKVRSKLPAWTTVVLLGVSFLLTLFLHLGFDGEHPYRIHLFDWFEIAWGHEAFLAAISLYVDSLTLFWMLFVTGLGTLIALYASEYMEPDVGRGYTRFFAGVSVFLLAMTCLVMGDNLILLYLGWEGVGFASYWLIGYYYTRPDAVAAAKKAFIVNRVGDLGLAIGIWLIFQNFGTVEYATLFERLAEGFHRGEPGGEGWSASLIPFFLMVGAFGKSAQFPLYVWLPDAMEGPTPVSALIHAATMVTAGVYLIARMYPVFLIEPASLVVVAWIGGFTALLAATIGMAQYDIKRIFAYSTVSQLGYMFLGLGVLTTFGAAYHVFTHAFFKAVLFLTCGAIMHGFAGQLDLRRLSGLRRLDGWKITAWTMFVGCLALAGLFPLSGFFSKDVILAEAFARGETQFTILGFVALFTAGLTAYYTFRVWFRVCAGPVHYEPGPELHDAESAHEATHEPAEAPEAAAAHGHGHGGFHPHAPRWAINTVLLLLALGTVLAALPYFLPAYGDGWVENMIEGTSAAATPVLHEGEHAEAHGTLLGFDPHTAMYVVSTIVALIGIATAWFFHLHRRDAADALRARLLASPATRWLPVAMENKWYVDEVYHALIRAPLWVFGHVLALFDKIVIDWLIVDGIARAPRAFARALQPLQHGLLQGYAVAMAGGTALIVLFVWWILTGVNG